MSKDNKLSGQPVICQLFSFIPPEVIARAVKEHNSDYYYKSMLTKNQLVFLLYGVITGCASLNALCKNLLFLDHKLLYLGIDKLPASSTLSDANIKRNSEVFGKIYSLLYRHYEKYLSDSCLPVFYNKDIDFSKVRIFDATTISLFVGLFKAAGRNPMNGKRKGGLKVQACMPLSGSVPDFVALKEAASNDRSFLGQLPCNPGTIYVFDKGYCNYQQFQKWSGQQVHFVTRLQENASYTVESASIKDIIEYAGGGVISDQIILLKSNSMKSPLKVRLITYKDPQSGKVYRFVSNLFDVMATTIAYLYKNRWSIEVLFKQLKQNFELNYFYSDKAEGIKTQIWVALIANLIFTVIHKQVKECEQFTTLVSMASNNMGSYISFLFLIQAPRLGPIERDLNKIQLLLFDAKNGGDFSKTNNSS